MEYLVKRPFGSLSRDVDTYVYKVDEDTLRVSIADDNSSWVLDEFYIGKDDLIEFPSTKFKMQGYGYALAFGVDMKKHILQFNSINTTVFEVIHNNKLLLKTDVISIKDFDKEDVRFICNGIAKLGKLVSVNCSLRIFMFRCVDFVMFFLKEILLG